MGNIKAQELHTVSDPYTIALSIPQVHRWQFCSVNLDEQHSLPKKELYSLAFFNHHLPLKVMSIRLQHLLEIMMQEKERVYLNFQSQI